ncbi:MAG: menaquinone-specific isochorismate synthase [Actinomycetota bacterium]|jgi:menaquinone-specific isochorismate synthase
MIDPTKMLLGAQDDDYVLLGGHDGGLVGRGVRARIDLPGGLGTPNIGERVGNELAALGSDAIAIGALSFNPYLAGSLVVPDEVWFAADGVGPSASDDEPALGPDAFTLTPSLSHADWCDLVADATDAIDAGLFAKVVLARAVNVTANRPIVVADVVRRLHDLYPSCTTYSIDGFVGASPELLIRRRGTAIASYPLAGTTARVGDPDADAAAADALLASAKDRNEHRLTVDGVADALRPYCTSVDVPDSPGVVALRNVTHLGTPINATLRDDAPVSVLDLVAALHPTAAVGGQPSAAALSWLAAHERLDRGRYAGPVGWVDGRGDGEWWVGIRSAEIDDTSAILRAGCGIVTGSDPVSELVESQLKLQALLAALVRP